MKYFILGFLLTLSMLVSAQSLKVGVYQNQPLIILDQHRAPSGFCIDVLNEVASRNGWHLEYKEYEFAECLKALESGEIDLMPALAYSPQRDSIFILNETNVITNWGKLYKRADDNQNYPSLERLRDKKIAVLASDYYYQNGEDGLLDMLNELDIPTEIVEFQSYSEVINNVSSGQADLGLVSRNYVVLGTADKSVVKTPINIAYVSIRYGFNRSKENAVLAKRLDNVLAALINDHSSVYYQSEKTYLSPLPQEFIPLWLWRTLAIVLIAVVVLVLFAILLQYQVNKKTRELKRSNRKLILSEKDAQLAVRTIEASQDIGFWFQLGQPFIRVNQAAIDLSGYSKEELLKMKPRDLLATDKNIEYYESLSEGNWDGHIRTRDSFKSKNGDIFPVELSLDEIHHDGQAYICGFARNISLRVKVEEELRERNKELSCLYEISKLIANRKNSIAEVFEGALKVIPSAMQHDSIAKAMISLKGKNYYSNDYEKCKWQLRAAVATGGKEVGEVIIGYTRSVSEEYEGPFLKEEVELVNAIGEELSNMLDSRDAERRIISSILLTEDKERSRISKELHDSVGQSLSAISLNLDSLANCQTFTSKERAKLEKIDELIKNATTEARSVSHNLMPPALTDLGYIYAVENLLNAIELSSETNFSFQSNESNIDVPKEVQFAFFRITQEAINNIIKYASASEATIQYLIFKDLISLSIEDNGKGFDLNNADNNHNFGLNSMRNRAASIGAEIIIDATPGKGTGIHISLPLT